MPDEPNQVPMTPSPAPPPPRAARQFRDWHEAPDFFTQINFLLAQYRPLVYLLLGAMTFFGFKKMQTPAERISVVETNDVRQDSIIGAVLTDVKANGLRSDRLEKLQCFNESYTPEVLEAVGMDFCAGLRDRLRRGENLPIPRIPVP